jgi:hypothetical protein
LFPQLIAKSPDWFTSFWLDAANRAFNGRLQRPVTVAMSKYDYSKEHAEGYLWAHKNLQPVSDEMFSKACAWNQPSPLAPLQMKLLMELLNENIPVPLGRPSSATIETRVNLVSVIEKLPDAKMPPLLRQLLVERLKSGKRYYEYERSLPHDKARQKNDRDVMIRIYYKVAYDALKRGSPPIVEIIGEVDDSVIDKRLPTRDRAIELAAILLRK